MILPLVLTVAAFSAATSADDAARIEQLIHHQAPVRAPARTPPVRAAAKPEAAATLIGQKVRVRTVDHGLYAGTLQSLDANNIVLRIDLHKQALSYTLPRDGVAELESAEPAP